jgi:hypothetical protein
MARPQKQTVDYFPHDAVAGKTLFILQSRFGNNGYAAWFKILALLCRTPGHFYDCNNPADWQFLVAETALSVPESQLVMDCLAELDAIDRELWAHRIIWSQNLVNRIADAYKDRKSPLPIKPHINVIKPPDNPIKPPDNPQSKLNKIKGNKTILNNNLPDWIDKELWEAFLEIRKKKRMPVTDKAFQLMIKDLTNWRSGGDDPNKVIEQSVKRGWGGLFELKDGRNGTHQKNTGRTGTEKPGDLRASIDRPYS